MKIDNRHWRTIWASEDGNSAQVIDQTKLPFAFETVTLAAMEDAAHAIRTMIVRGAPLIGATAAYGIALAMRSDAGDTSLQQAVTVLGETRPTAVNLRWALERMEQRLSHLPASERAAVAWSEAALICNEDVEISRSIGRHGLELIRAAKEKKNGIVNILTHCNAGW
ncbi:MAG: S-methyl-5-thioribose-1-phosphate isomerase, partial [Hyphomicrobiales bacterium]|nr:S-methyl-5-thioribose-1-phosphate isomerase [Hyphomicrobiales bacterium]